MSRYQFIGACAEPWPVQVLCRMLAVSPAGYYQWRQRPPRPIAGWQEAAQAAFTRHARRYDTCRLRAELRAEGHVIDRYALRSWLQRQGSRALSTRPLRPRTTVAENRLLGQPAPTALNQVWVGDITYLACSRRVVGWHLAAQMPTELVLLALEQTLTLRQPAPGRVVHADRGSRYTNAACRARLQGAKGRGHLAQGPLQIGFDHVGLLRRFYNFSGIYQNLRPSAGKYKVWPRIVSCACAHYLAVACQCHRTRVYERSFS